MTLYRRLADDFRLAISRGVYRPGDKLPSVRVISRNRHLSVNTVLKACAVLEQEGWVAATERTGYFVTHRDAGREPLGRPWTGEFSDLMPTLLENTRSASVVNLGLAQPEAELIPHAVIAKELRSVLRESGPDILGYCDPAGLPELRKQIASTMTRKGVRTDVDGVVITNGCQEAIHIAIQALTGPGDIVAVQSPCYCGALQALNSLGRRILEIPSAPGRGIDQRFLQRAASRYRIAACYVMTGVSNPMAGRMTAEARQSLCELARREGIPVIEDYTSGELAFDDEARQPLKAHDADDNVTLCSSFSKTISPGLRVGWIQTARRRRQVLTAKYGASLNVSALNQLTVSKLIAAGHYRRHLARTRAVHAQTLRILRESIERQFPCGTVVSAPAGGFFLWVRLPAGFDTMEICRVTAARDVLFAPGAIFSVSRDFSNYLRIGWGGSWDQRIADGTSVVAAAISGAG